jgi:hypothetical protein
LARSRRFCGEVCRRQKGESVAKAESPPKADSLDEQISSLLESIEVDGKETPSPEPPLREEGPARPRRSLPRPSNGSKSTPAPPARTQANATPVPPPARKRAEKASARRKAAPVAKEAAPRRKPPPARRAVQTRPRPRAKAHAHAPPRAGVRRHERHKLFADPATRELAFFVIAGLMIGAVVGVLFALAG